MIGMGITKEQFAAFLTQLAKPELTAGTMPGFNVDSWCRRFAAEAAEKVAYDAGPAFRADTVTGLFEEQLQAVLAGDYDRPYAGLAMRTHMAPASGIPAGAQTVVQRGYDMTGRPKLLVNEASEIPRVSLHAAQNVGRIVGYGLKWRINYDELQAAAMAGVDLDGKGLAACRILMEREIDFLLASGNAAFGIVGMLTGATKAPLAAGAGIELYVTGAPAAMVCDWDGVATAAQILNDFAILMATRFYLGNVHMPTDCLFGNTSWARIETLQAFATSDKTVLEVLRGRYPGINFRHEWRCNNANAGGNNDRCVLYERSPLVIESVVSLEPTQLPPVWDGFGWETVTYARCGGVLMADTTGICYIDM